MIMMGARHRARDSIEDLERYMVDKAKLLSTAREKFLEEMRKLLWISAYMLLCVGALLLYRLSIPSVENIGLWHFGYAVLKALVLAKFVMLGHMLHIGQRRQGKPLIYSSVYQAAALGMLLIVMVGLEEIAIALYHGRSFGAAIAEVASGAVHRVLSQGLIMFLMLLPYVALLQLGDVLGAGSLKRLLFHPITTSLQIVPAPSSVERHAVH